MTSAMSSGSAIRPSGTDLLSSAIAVSGSKPRRVKPVRSIGVLTSLGQTALTRMPSPAWSRPRHFDKAATAALLAVVSAAAAETKYPNLRGQWNTLSPRGSFDPDKPPGRKTLAPLTEEYQKIYDQNVAEQLGGGHGWETSYMCLPPGMPRAMIAYESMEVVVTPERV